MSPKRSTDKESGNLSTWNLLFTVLKTESKKNLALPYTGRGEAQFTLHEISEGFFQFYDGAFNFFSWNEYFLF